MAIVSTSSGAGQEWSNMIDSDTVDRFLFGQTQAPLLSGDGTEVTFTFGDEQLVFTAVNTFTLGPPTGTIGAFETSDTVVSGVSVPLASFFALIGDGDVDALNAAVWAGADTINGGASNDTIRGFGGSDTLFGNDGNDSLIGDAGSDKLYGGNGDDRLSGGTGTDKLYGQGGSDQLLGGSGNDQLTGGAGYDRLVGGSGADVFIWKSASEFGALNPNQLFAADFVRDFNRADGDKLDVSGVDANSGLAGNQAFAFIGSNAFGTNAAGQVRVATTSFPGIFHVEFNTDADSAAEYAFVVIGLSGAPTAADFVL